MSRDDKATDEQSKSFENKKMLILSLAKNWSLETKKYLEAVLEELEVMTAYYSYGNGEITIENKSLWRTLDSDLVLPMINKLITPQLGIELSEVYSKFPTTLWFETGII